MTPLKMLLLMMISAMPMFKSSHVFSSEPVDNESNQNQESFAYSESRKSHSCPDPSLITALLQMASLLDSDSDYVAEYRPQNIENATIKSDSPKSPSSKTCNQYTSMHDRRSKQSIASHNSPPIQIPASPPLDVYQQLRAIEELPRTTEPSRNDNVCLPQWNSFMISFGQWMDKRPFTTDGIWKNLFEFSIGGFDAAKNWVLKVHLDWITNVRELRKQRIKIKVKAKKCWIGRQTGWLQFVFSPHDSHEGVVNLNEIDYMKWRIVNGCYETNDWVIEIRGRLSQSGFMYPFKFCISKAMPSAFFVNFMESERNRSDPNQATFVQSENRKSYSCPDPALINALLQMVSPLDSEESVDKNIKGNGTERRTFSA